MTGLRCSISFSLLLETILGCGISYSFVFETAMFSKLCVFSSEILMLLKVHALLLCLLTKEDDIRRQNA